MRDQRCVDKVSTRDLFAFAEDGIRQAAERLWPDRRVEVAEHVPSITGYVRRVVVGDSVAFAKTSILGVSLISIVRGRRGSWSEVRAAQRLYVHAPHNLVAREAEHLRFLAKLGGPRVVEVAGYTDGVLVTKSAAGHSLADIAVADPERVAELLPRVWEGLAPLHRAEPGLSVSVGTERDITSTFARKFGDSAAVERLGMTDARASAAVARVAALLRRWSAPTLRGGGLVFGDLKPEHIFVADEGTVTFVDPGLACRPAVVDVAKLVSRCLLGLWCAPPDSGRDTVVLSALHDFVGQRAADVSPHDRGTWWRDLVVLWLCDTLNIVSSTLAAPPDLPLPTYGAIADHVHEICLIVELVIAMLAQAVDAVAAWACGLREMAVR